MCKWNNKSNNEKFEIILFNKEVGKGALNYTLISLDIIKSNLDKFNGAEITYQPDFKVPINKTMIKGNNKNNTFKILLNENYSYFITSLKKISHI